ncbi:hypothetical protein [Candidatus Harpocratesius sp.]
MSEEIWLNLECPTCHTPKKVKLPRFIFEKNSNSLKKVQIDSGVCCEHSFVAFISPSLKIVGYEIIDMIADITKKINRKTQKLTLSQILEKYGEEITLLLFHAVIIETPIIILAHQDSSINQAMFLNHFFNQILPSEIKNPFLFSEMQDETQLIGKTDQALVITTENKVKNISWESIPFNFEKELIEKALDILDPEMQIEVMRDALETLFKYANKINEIFKEWERLDRRYYRKLGKINEYKPKLIYIEDLKSAAEREFQNQISEYGLHLIAQILYHRFHVNFYLDNLFNQDIAKKMPKTKGKRKFFRK